MRGLLRRGPRLVAPTNALRETRLAQGLTVRELGERAGLSSMTVSSAERRMHAAPRPKTAALLAEALGVAVTDLWSPSQLAASSRKRVAVDVVEASRPKRRLRGFGFPDGGIPVVHYHKPPICCGTCWCRIVNLSDPETYRSVEQPLVPLSVGHA